MTAIVLLGILLGAASVAILLLLLWYVYRDDL